MHIKNKLIFKNINKKKNIEGLVQASTNMTSLHVTLPLVPYIDLQPTCLGQLPPRRSHLLVVTILHQQDIMKIRSSTASGGPCCDGFYTNHPILIHA